MITPPGSVEPEIQIELAPVAGSVTEARHAVAELAESVGAAADDVRIAVSEAVGNAVIHAFRERNPGRIVIRAWVEARRLMVIVGDDGRGMSANLESPGLGLGIALITRVADEARFESDSQGTSVHMAFELAR